MTPPLVDLEVSEDFGRFSPARIQTDIEDRRFLRRARNVARGFLAEIRKIPGQKEGENLRNLLGIFVASITERRPLKVDKRYLPAIL